MTLGGGSFDTWRGLFIAAPQVEGWTPVVAGQVYGTNGPFESPEKLQRFVSFVNAPDAPDADLAYVPERGQHRPATPEERASGAVLATSGLEIHA